jgi:glycosyltransferase involved in cell wall biosynthesis
MMSISVVIPTHNRAALLANAIESVFAQTCLPHELIIVDDGSTEDIRSVLASCRENGKCSQLPIIYIRQEQGGAPVARNTGVAAATGDWVAFLDSDDRWLPSKLELQVQTLERFAGLSEACVTDAVYVNNPDLQKSAFQQAGTRCSESVGIFPEIIKQVAYGYHGIYLQALVVRRQLVVDVGGFDPSLKLGDDTDLIFQIANRTSICYVNSPLVEIDRTPNRTDGLIELARKERFGLEMSELLYARWLKKPDRLAPEILERVFWRLQEVHSGWSSWHLINGDYHSARKSLARAIRYRFTSKVAFKWLLTVVAPGVVRSAIVKRRAKATPDLLF